MFKICRYFNSFFKFVDISIQFAPKVHTKIFCLYTLLQNKNDQIMPAVPIGAAGENFLKIDQIFEHLLVNFYICHASFSLLHFENVKSGEKVQL